MNKYYYEVNIKGLLIVHDIPIQDEDFDALSKSFTKWAENRGITIAEKEVTMREFTESKKFGL